MKIKKVGIVANIEKENIAAFAGALAGWLENRKIKVSLEANIAAAVGGNGGFKLDDLAARVDLIAVLGGDGTMLRTARYVAQHPVPIVGINMGTFGYLTEVNLNETYAALELKAIPAKKDVPDYIYQLQAPGTTYLPEIDISI